MEITEEEVESKLTDRFNLGFIRGQEYMAREIAKSISEQAGRAFVEGRDEEAKLLRTLVRAISKS